MYVRHIKRANGNLSRAYLYKSVRVGNKVIGKYMGLAPNPTLHSVKHSSEPVKEEDYNLPAITIQKEEAHNISRAVERARSEVDKEPISVNYLKRRIDAPQSLTYRLLGGGVNSDIPSKSGGNPELKKENEVFVHNLLQDAELIQPGIISKIRFANIPINFIESGKNTSITAPSKTFLNGKIGVERVTSLNINSNTTPYGLAHEVAHMQQTQSGKGLAKPGFKSGGSWIPLTPLGTYSPTGAVNKTADESNDSNVVPIGVEVDAVKHEIKQTRKSLPKSLGFSQEYQNGGNWSWASRSELNRMVGEEQREAYKAIQTSTTMPDSAKKEFFGRARTKFLSARAKTR